MMITNNMRWNAHSASIMAQTIILRPLLSLYILPEYPPNMASYATCICKKTSWNSTRLHWVSCLFKVNFLHVFLNGVQFVKFENNSLKLSKLYHIFLVCLNNWKLLMKSHFISVFMYCVDRASKGKHTCLMYKMKRVKLGADVPG